MREEALIEELRSLRVDIDELNSRMVRLRYQDFQEVFVEQVRSALGQEGKRSFDSSLDRMLGASECDLKRECLAKQQEVIASVIAMVERDEVQEAIQALDSLEAVVCGQASPCMDPSCSRSATEGICRVKAILGAYQGLKQRLGAEAGIPRPIGGNEGFSPEDMERALNPLSNSWRLRILLMLNGADRTMSEMAKELDMRTGHLQFHVRSLKDAGYISPDPRRRSYSITERGRRALVGLSGLMGDLSAGPAALDPRSHKI